MADFDGVVLVVVEVRRVDAAPASVDMLSTFSQLMPASEIAVSVIGWQAGRVAEQLAGYQPSVILIADDPSLELYSMAPYAAVIERSIARVEPRLVLLANTTAGRDLGPYLAARHGAPWATNCHNPRVEDDWLVVDRSILEGRAIVSARLSLRNERTFVVVEGSPEATYTPSPVAPSPIVELIEIEAPPGEASVRVVEGNGAGADEPGLAEAEIIVCGGRGVGSAQNFELIEEVARLLNGRVGATGAAVEAGWRPAAEKIGQTGSTVRPRLYIGVGVSGAPQHLAGIRQAETIVAINRDENAPLARLADIVVRAEIETFLPALIAELQRARGGDSDEQTASPL
jgi:electron transfer flavoprotein alpha subunit